MAIIGLDIGGTKILGAVFNDQGQIMDKEKQPSKADDGFERFMQQVYHVIDELINRSDESIQGIGIGFPGTIDQNGHVIFAPNLPVEQFDLAGHLADRYHTKVLVGNDVNLGTYGEYCELDIPYKNVIGLFPGTGLGGGIVINGELYIGQGSAGELGHIVVRKNGVKCSCGNKGCLESYASKKGILAYIKKEMKKGRKTVLKKEAKAGVVKSSQLRKAVEDGDVLTIEAIDQFKAYLGMGVGIIMNIFNPDLVIIGGGIVENFGKELMKDIRKHAKAYTLPGIYENTKLRHSKLGDDTVIYGGYHLIKSAMSTN
ncbi:ROK family protein [Candidatus Xianfuyuplasma coldseepsis]|uniref:ROK family protein n=1 Tax=Candidatus Xianfuyuplasma coldseepsis TaxID=2782163 RepID=A0A7L7KRI0_9MOLU|nr:ROK family protein [Xianfuyuplasma coldseepsis]QMS85317.1 ROK family protein [Xianfuyuplasma coldseepsis]